MRYSRDFDQNSSVAASAAVGWDMRMLLLADEGAPALAHRLAALAGGVETEADPARALARVIEDPLHFGLIVADCDSLGGAEAGERLNQTLVALGLDLPLILLGRDFVRQDFPAIRARPTCLRAPVSTISLRVGFEHALRDRLAPRAA
ncbi:hypothetical protein [Pseudogemmobacter sonorensis]|uniref:hypothetical protein n=1 Tax=Pseudogemmobacter sonorensis TaxID=2989681 RepID=UPI003679C240